MRTTGDILDLLTAFERMTEEDLLRIRAELVAIPSARQASRSFRAPSERPHLPAVVPVCAPVCAAD